MYGSKWPFLFMYRSHAMRQTGFPQVDGLSTDPWVFGRHKIILNFYIVRFFERIISH